MNSDFLFFAQTNCLGNNWPNNTFWLDLCGYILELHFAETRWGRKVRVCNKPI